MTCRDTGSQWKPGDAAAVVAALADTVDRLSRNNVEPVAVDVAESAQRKKVKQAKFKTDTRVGRIIERSVPLLDLSSADVLGSYDTALSSNKVTGYSVNVPISATCRPTAVCLKTCYFAVGAPSWSNGLHHQAKIYRSMKQDPVGFAERVALEYDSKQLSFLRWNGGGDLFGESVDVINHLAKMRPDIVLWVVTRIPEYAAKIENSENVFIHFSLDKDSLPRKSKFLRSRPKSRKYFFSYQAAPDELPPLENLKDVSVLFFDNYNPPHDLSLYPEKLICPLNTQDQITDTCVNCRRCFNGDAVNYPAGL